MYDSAASLSQLQTWFELSQFFAREADLLDSGREAEWLELLAPTFRYRVPLRSVRLRKEGWSAQFSDTGFHIDDDRGAVEQRVRRLATGSAYAEDPVSRSRHHVSCVRVLDADAQGVWRCESNVLLTRRNGPETQTAVISAHRFDRVRREAGRWLLVERIVHLDHTVLPMNNLAVII
jgi:3-phenylpropionate/cinnamic acid dioxygenase small subunit